ncbi:hypothetical protein B4153_4092 [Bacillus cereus]|nr:hypothetical protein B4153_4092 [Bacillus cereus]KLA15334.1 hypothetical protein B4078_3755 [Bacillus cereus]
MTTRFLCEFSHVLPSFIQYTNIVTHFFYICKFTKTKKSFSALFSNYYVF